MADPKELLERRLLPGLDNQWANCAKADRYYRGEHDFEIASTKYRQEFARMLNAVCDNWMPLIIDAVEERLEVTGFRFNVDRNNPDTDADMDAWDIWQRNFLDEDSLLGFQAALTCGISYLMVWGNGDGEPIITAEHPSQTYVLTAAGNRRERIAAVKRWEDEWTQEVFVNLYMPDALYRLVKGGDGWVEREPALTNPLGIVPIVPIVNRGDLFGNGKSEIAEGISTQDQINKLVKDMLVASEFAAFRQRWVTGIELPVDENGNEINPFKSGVDRLLVANGIEGGVKAEFGEFGASDLNNYVRAIENRIQSLASRTRTPPHYLLGQSGQFPSGESLRAAETGLVAKVKRRRNAFGEALEEAMRIAFLVKQDTVRGNAFRAQTIWRDPESRTESEFVDSLVKLMAIGVPKRVLWERYGFTQTEMERFETLLLEEALATNVGNSAADIKAAADAMGALVRAGAEGESAADIVGLEDLEFTGAVPTTLRLPDRVADDLEET